MHDAVTGGAVDQEEVLHARGTTQDSMFVWRHLIEARPGCCSVDRNVLKRGHALVRHPGHRRDPGGIHANIEWPVWYARAGAEEKNAAIAHPEVKSVSRKDCHWHVRGEPSTRDCRGDLPAQRGDR